jgi:hypothetical protein
MTSLLLLALACKETGTGGYDLDGDTASDDDAPRPGVEITSPLEGSGFYGGTGTLTFALTNWTLDATAVGGTDAEGRGHAHLYVDEALAMEVTETAVPISGLTSGPHKLRVALATNDHGEFGEDSTVDIAAASPRVRITAPAEATLLARSSAKLALEVLDFTMTAPTPGEPPGFAQGYVQLSVDGVPWDWTTDTVETTVTRLLPGPHTIGVELRAADGSELPVPARDQVAIVVEPTAEGVAIDAGDIPTDGSPWDSAAVPLSLTTSNFTLGGSNAYHLYVDDDFYASGTASSTSVCNLSPGDHVVEVRLTNGTSETGTYDRVRVRVTEDRPDIRVTYPGARWRVHPDFTMSLAVENFELQPRGSGPATDRGHYQVSMDGTPLVSGSSEAIAMNRLPLGLHTFRVELLDDAGAPLAPPAFTEVDFTVEPVDTTAP